MPRTPSASALARTCSQSTGDGMRLSSAAMRVVWASIISFNAFDVKARGTRRRRLNQGVTGEGPQAVLELDRLVRGGLEARRVRHRFGQLDPRVAVPLQ